VEFDWSPDDIAHRAEIKSFLHDVLPGNWDEMSAHGPGSDVQAHYSREFCGKIGRKNMAGKMRRRGAMPWLARECGR
jgi:hypothetical protein